MNDHGSQSLHGSSSLLPSDSVKASGSSIGRKMIPAVALCWIAGSTSAMVKGRLRRIQPVSGMAKLKLLGDRDEGAKMPQFHVAVPFHRSEV